MLPDVRLLVREHRPQLVGGEEVDGPGRHHDPAVSARQTEREGMSIGHEEDVVSGDDAAQPRRVEPARRPERGPVAPPDASGERGEEQHDGQCGNHE